MSPEVLGPIREVYGDRARTMVANSGQPQLVTTETVYQEANTNNRRLIDQILDELVLPKTVQDSHLVVGQSNELTSRFS